MNIVVLHRDGPDLFAYRWCVMTDTYERYGEEWAKEMMRLSKEDLVDFLRTAYKKARPVDAQIDEEFRPLIEELNKAGLITTQCCSGHGGTKTRYLSIDLTNIEDLAIRENEQCGKRVVFVWDGMMEHKWASGHNMRWKDGLQPPRRDARADRKDK